MIIKEQEVWFKNKFGFRFMTEEAALEDEQRRESCPFKINVIGNGKLSLAANPIEAIDDSKYPWTGQPNGKCVVFLLKDIVATYNQLILHHGENVGITNHHCGMGNYLQEIVILEDNTAPNATKCSDLFNGYADIKPNLK